MNLLEKHGRNDILNEPIIFNLGNEVRMCDIFGLSPNRLFICLSERRRPNGIFFLWRVINVFHRSAKVERILDFDGFHYFKFTRVVCHHACELLHHVRDFAFPIASIVGCIFTICVEFLMLLCEI